MGAISIVVVGPVGLGLFANKHLEISNELWWQFAFHGDAPRFLRASVGILVVVTFFALSRLLKPSPPARISGTEADYSIVKDLVRASPDTSANLALLKRQILLVQ